MTRIFLTLISLHAVLTAVTIWLGFVFEPHNLHAPTYHWHAGLWNTLFTTLIHSIVITYFVGTGRWIREVSRVYKFSGAFHDRSWKAKMQAIPFAMGSIFIIIVAAGFGASADPGSTVQLKEWMGLTAVPLHFVTVLFALSVNLLTYFFEYQALLENSAIIDSVMQEVAKVRASFKMQQEQSIAQVN